MIELGIEMSQQIRASRNRYELLSLGLYLSVLHALTCYSGLEGKIKLIWDHEGDAILNYEDEDIKRSHIKLSGNLSTTTRCL
jgi:hypothetical protein